MQGNTNHHYEFQFMVKWFQIPIHIVLALQLTLTLYSLKFLKICSSKICSYID